MSRSGELTALARRARGVEAGHLRPAPLASRAAWVALAAVAVLLLAVGSVHGGGPSRASRIAYLESVIKCPSCTDLTVAESSAPTAQTLRRLVSGWVDAGHSDSWIERQVVEHYGQADLLVPAASGLDGLAWTLPIAAVALAAGALGAFLWRRRVAGGPRAVTGPGVVGAVPGPGAVGAVAAGAAGASPPGSTSAEEDELLVGAALAARAGAPGRAQGGPPDLAAPETAGEEARGKVVR